MNVIAAAPATRGRRRNRRLLNVAALGGLLAQLALAASAHAAFSSAVQLTQPPNAGFETIQNPSGVSCPAAGACVAVGTRTDFGFNGETAIWQQSSGTWGDAQTTTSLPANAVAASEQETTLQAVSCPAAGDCVAAGSYVGPGHNGEAMVLPENSGSWGTAGEIDPPANAESGASLEAISCPSIGTCTATGHYTNNQGHAAAMVASESAGVWGAAVEIPLPGNAKATQPTEYDNQFADSFVAVSCHSSEACTAVGNYLDTAGHDQGMTVTETSGSWGAATELTLPANASTEAVAFLAGVSCHEAGDCSAVGGYKTEGGEFLPLAATESASSFTAAEALKLPAGAGTYVPTGGEAISCTAVGDCAAVGSFRRGSTNDYALALTESSGTWSTGVEVELPSGAPGGLRSIACTGTQSCTAVGKASGRVAAAVSETSGTWGAPDVLAQPAGEVTHQDGRLASVSCPASGSCAAVGGFFDSNEDLRPMVVSETAGSWAAAKEPTLPGNASSFGDDELFGVSCTAPGDCTAVGHYGMLTGEGALITSESSGSWNNAVDLSLPANAQVSGRLMGVSCPTTGNCAAVGSYITTGNRTGALAATESGGVWGTGVAISPPANKSATSEPTLAAVSCTAAGECTAVGGYLTNTSEQEGMVAREVAGTWQPAVEIPAPASGESVILSGIDCPEAGQCVAVGGYSTAGGEGGLIVPESAGTWGAAMTTVLPANAKTSEPYEPLQTVSCAKAGDCLAVGEYLDSSEHYDAFVVPDVGGTWGADEVIAPPAGSTGIAAGLSGVSCLSSGSCTTVGFDSAPHEDTEPMAATGTITLASGGGETKTGGGSTGGGTTGGGTTTTATTTSTTASGGASSPGPSTDTTVASSARIESSLAGELIPTGKTAKIASLLKQGVYTLRFQALAAGTAEVDWYEVPHGAKIASKAKAVLVASGRLTFTAAGTATMKIKLTAAGKRLLKHTTRLKLTAKGTFTPNGKPRVTVLKQFTLKR